MNQSADERGHFPPVGNGCLPPRGTTGSISPFQFFERGGGASSSAPNARWDLCYHRHRGVRITIVLLAVTMAGGCTGGSVDERSTLSESVITEIMPSGKLSVTTLRPAVPAGTWRLANVPAVQIGLADGNPAYLFQRVIHAHSLPDGRTVVLDAGAGEIRSFDREGRHIRSTSRPGPGPGELQNPMSVQRLSGRLDIGNGVRRADFSLR